jgi:putative ABC transport system ATP-binding protein
VPDLLVQNIAMRYPGLNAPVLAVDRLGIASGERVAVVGPSGSGKSTFVNLITGLERAAGGSIIWDGIELVGLGEGARDRWRSETIGLVMQDFHLFPGLSALENVLLPARLAGVAKPDVIARAKSLITRVGLSRANQDVATMSRGEMQRVAVARAVLRRPGVIVADEPTASLDADSGAAVTGLLLDLAREEQCTLVVVTHDHRLMDGLDRRIGLDAGQIVTDIIRVPA